MSINIASHVIFSVEAAIFSYLRFQTLHRNTFFAVPFAAFAGLIAGTVRMNTARHCALVVSMFLYCNAALSIALLDPTFGIGGVARIGVADGFDDVATASVMQPDGKLIVAGYSTGRIRYPFVVRFTSTGRLDPAFGDSGVTRLRDAFYWRWNAPIQLELQPDGSLIILGTSNSSSLYSSLTKLNRNGILDARFGTNGTVEFEFDSYGRGIHLSTQADGKLVVLFDATSSDARALILVGRRFSASGALDKGWIPFLYQLPKDFKFDSSRLAVTEPNGGFTIIARRFPPGSGYVMLRIKADMSLDTSFGGIGYVSGTGTPEHLARSPSGRYVIVGSTSTSTDDVVWKVESNGQPASVAAGGLVALAGAALSRAVTAFADESVAVASSFSGRFVFERFDTAGNAVSGFGMGGAMAVMVPDYPFSAIVGLHANDNGLTLAADAYVRTISGAYQPITRGHDVVVTSVNAYGILRGDFGSAGIAKWNDPALSNDRIDSLYLDPAGRIMVAGYSESEGLSDPLLSRLTPDGAVDASYDGTGRLLAQVQPTLLGPVRAVGFGDGATLVAATGATSPDGWAATTMFRATPDGMVDSSYKPVPLADIASIPVAIAARPDGRTLHATRAKSGSYVVQQFLQDGSPDPAFGASGELWLLNTDPMWTTPYTDLKLLPDGSAMFAAFAGQDIHLYKINTDGTLAKSFGDNGRATAAADPAKGVVEGADNGQMLFAMPDGSFVVTQGVGSSFFWPNYQRPNLFVARMSSTGQVTSALNVLEGRVAQYLQWNIASLPDGSLLIARYNTLAATLDRLLPDGTLDPSFGAGGMYALAGFQTVSALTTDSQGRVLVGGQDGDGAIVARYRMDSAIAQPSQKLALTVKGRGSGTVSSFVGGMYCSASCEQSFPYGSTVTLLPYPNPDVGSQFAGWLGDCTGRGLCTVTMNRPINVSATFAPASPPLTLDVDGNGKYEALSDGLLLLRYLMGLTGNALTSGTGMSSDGLADRLDNLRPMLDADGNGVVDGLTDGLLILRAMFGLRDDALVTNAMGSRATRSSAAAVTRYLDSISP